MIIISNKIQVLEKDIKNKLVFHTIKRTFDLVMAIMLFGLLSPVLLVLLVAVKVDSKGPAIFKQKRLGKNNKEFYIYKFRTMFYGTPELSSRDCNPSKSVTRVGKILRKTSLDELPQLINIIKGDMSFVGYRPLILKETDIHGYRNQFYVYQIKPGITGYAQINGRDLVEPFDKARYDYYYLLNRSIFLDFKILFITVVKVLKREGVHDGKYVTDRYKDQNIA
jgi:O-antigen biosynthesis protein WbqP